MADQPRAAFRAVSISNEPIPTLAEALCAELWDAAAVIGSIFRIEEVYGYVIESWLSFDDEVAFHKRRALRWINAKAATRKFFYEARASIDVRLLTFLSTTRMYLDQAKTSVTAIPGAPAAFRQRIQHVRSSWRRRNHFFLVSDEFRNLMQHENLGLDRIRSGWESRATETAPAAWAATLMPEVLSIDGLRKAIQRKQDKASRAAARDPSNKQARTWREQCDTELAVLNDVSVPINVQSYMKHFSAAISEIHASLRQDLRPLEEQSCALYEAVITGHGDTRFPEPGVRIQRIDDSGEVGGEAWIGRTLIDRLKVLRELYSGWERVRDLSE